MDRPLRAERFLVLIDQLAEELGSYRKAAKEIGIDPSYVTQLRSDPTRGIGADTIDKARRKLGLQSRFFLEPKLGPRPDYHDFLGAEPEETEVRAHPAVEAYIARETAAGQPVPDAHQRELRSYRSSEGPDSITIEVVEGLHRGLRARDAMRELRRPDLSRDLDSSKGERKLPPAKKRSR